MPSVRHLAFVISPLGASLKGVKEILSVRTSLFAVDVKDAEAVQVPLDPVGGVRRKLLR